MALPSDDMGWFAVCDCDISWSYSFFLKLILGKSSGYFEIKLFLIAET